MFFFAQVPAVVSPEDDDRVVAMRAVVQGVDQSADHGVGVGDGGQVTLNGVFPAARFENCAVISVGLGHLDAGRGHVGQIVGGKRRKLDLVQRVQVVILAWHVPGHVRLVQSDGQEERPIVRLLELLDPIANDLPFAQILIGAVQRREANAADATIAGGERIAVDFGEIVVPFAAAGKSVVIDLARTGHEVAGLAKGGGEHPLLGDDGAPVLAVGVDAGGGGAQPTHQRGARGIAHRGGAVAAGETDAATREAVEVGGDGLWVAAEVADPMIEVVHGDEEHIGPRIGGGAERRQGQQTDQRKDEKFLHGGAAVQLPFTG
jgi:hypothetical protein